MTEHLLARYDRRVPRYTSYPTAPHFGPAVDGGTYASWLAAVSPDRTVSLYVHVPFCDTLCWFCGCHTKIVRRYRPVAAYLDAVLDELTLVAHHLARGVRLSHLHWGGGSPTILAPRDVLRLAEAIREYLPLAHGAEFAVEIDPRDLSGEEVDTLAAAGVTRASIGVQDLDESVQRAINRMQSLGTTRSAVERLRAAGIASVNLDLVYGLPHQTTEGLATTLHRLLELEPERIALFGYAHVPGFKPHQRLIDEAALPGPRERFAQATTAARILIENGYVRVGLDHFARPDDSLTLAAQEGTLMRNFQGYTTDCADVLLGIGPSAIGSLPQGYVQNAVPLPHWREAITAGRLPTARGYALTPADRERRRVIDDIMCRLEAEVPSSLMPDAGPALKDMEADGLVTLGRGRVQVTEQGRPFVRTVAAAFDAFLEPESGRHVNAV